MLLEIRNLNFSHRPDQPLFQDLNVSIEKGKIVALVGESGCGKSTLLNLIYGYMDWQGDIIFDGKTLLGPKGNIVPGESEMKFVAQHYDLMPYATVAENVGKFISNINLKAKKEKVMELLDVVGMQEFADILPKYLSGGQQQRVAIARALSVTPKLLLLDEPFSNLDYSRKLELREKLFSYVIKEGLSLIISTHDVQEVMPWLDEILFIQHGKIIQQDTPQNAYLNPKNQYVARLFGEVNIISDEEKQSLQLSKNFYFPPDITISESGIPCKVLESRFAGSYYWTKVDYKGKDLIVYTPNKVEETVNILLS